MSSKESIAKPSSVGDALRRLALDNDFELVPLPAGRGSAENAASAGSDKPRASSDEKKGDTQRTPKLPLGALLGRRKGALGMHGRFKLCIQTSVQTNPSQPKYLMYFPAFSSTALAISNVGTAVEWASFNAVFDEFFVHSLTIRYEPVNNIGGALPDSATATNMQNCMMVWAGYQHNQVALADGSTAVAYATDSSQHKIANTGRAHFFKWTNIEKFAKDGPLTDSGSAGYSQGWINVSNYTHYGGTVNLANFHATGAAVGLGVWATAVETGNALCIWDVSFRYRS